MTNSIVWDLEKNPGNEKWQFSYEVHEKNSSNRNATWLPMCHWTPRGKNKWFLTPAPEGAKELNNFFHKNEQKIERSEWVCLFGEKKIFNSWVTEGRELKTICFFPEVSNYIYIIGYVAPWRF